MTQQLTLSSTSFWTTNDFQFKAWVGEISRNYFYISGINISVEYVSMN